MQMPIYIQEWHVSRDTVIRLFLFFSARGQTESSFHVCKYWSSEVLYHPHALMMKSRVLPLHIS